MGSLEGKLVATPMASFSEYENIRRADPEGIVFLTRTVSLPSLVGRCELDIFEVLLTELEIGHWAPCRTAAGEHDMCALQQSRQTGRRFCEWLAQNHVFSRRDNRVPHRQSG